MYLIPSEEDCSQVEQLKSTGGIGWRTQCNMTQVLKMPEVLKAHSTTSTVIMNHISCSLQFLGTSYFQLVPNQKKILTNEENGKSTAL